MAAKKPKVKVTTTHGVVLVHEDDDTKRRIEVLRSSEGRYVLALHTTWPGIEEPTKTELHLSQAAYDMLNLAMGLLSTDLAGHAVREGKLRMYDLTLPLKFNIEPKGATE
jgi:hypothetical protein